MASERRQLRSRRRAQLVADGFARAVARASPKRRAWAMRGPQRQIILGQIFRGMERQLDRSKAEGVDAVIHWEIGGRRDGGVDRWQIAVGDGRCRANRRLDREPTITIEIDGVRFLELSAGIVSGPELFMGGKLKIRGDIMFATRALSLFRIPRPEQR